MSEAKFVSKNKLIDELNQIYEEIKYDKVVLYISTKDLIKSKKYDQTNYRIVYSKILTKKVGEKSDKIVTTEVTKDMFISIRVSPKEQKMFDKNEFVQVVIVNWAGHYMDKIYYKHGVSAISYEQSQKLQAIRTKMRDTVQKQEKLFKSENEEDDFEQ